MGTVSENLMEQIETAEQEIMNPLANVWLGILAILFAGTLACTTVLVAWPILAKLTAG